MFLFLLSFLVAPAQAHVEHYAALEPKTEVKKLEFDLGYAVVKPIGIAPAKPKVKEPTSRIACECKEGSIVRVIGYDKAPFTEKEVPMTDEIDSSDDTEKVEDVDTSTSEDRALDAQVVERENERVKIKVREENDDEMAEDQGT